MAGEGLRSVLRVPGLGYAVRVPVAMIKGPARFVVIQQQMQQLHAKVAELEARLAAAEAQLAKPRRRF